ncbi:hypothetical protein I636_13070 [Alteromonas mediterranea UM4b]|uniref:Uncharacterized protein n=1 Tax=Alteromonas mediterranea 615 TaxID=1300253 RepID=S5AIF6_9ALTE|nr:hypothetical protein I633_13875 [Alteromonas mediterranea 615]AGP90459.1 hypothetical protein I876_13060 [Alteromonas mediterranea U7]AGP94279.1 hypothetical protein I634_12920 [Alteromonas mediterranea U8]AGQ02459.1 hypothetical protein I636_13070 [Alteromonas mediterranea UM4b]
MWKLVKTIQISCIFISIQTSKGSASLKDERQNTNILKRTVEHFLKYLMVLPNFCKKNASIHMLVRAIV